MTLELKPYGARPTFPVEKDAARFELEGYKNMVIADSLFQCKTHFLQVCAECDVDYSLENFLSKQMSHDGRGIPHPSPEIHKKVQDLKNQGNSFFRTKNFAEAAAKYSEALNLSNQRPPWDSGQIISEETSVLYCNRAACFLEIGKYAEAFWDTEVVIKLKRSWGKAHYRRGKALFMLARYKESIESFELAIVFGSDGPETTKALKSAKDMI
ncbi:hypothetical protein BB561_000100 [Smittium simulii]|uniref:Uncharacterized protein n=1 Tax=Smittium simulii TaxID=133385 RepID=A0A2T9Z0H7_9FUNG|nr:hypothetical protein BB561_000100 [Smittium simulii]